MKLLFISLIFGILGGLYVAKNYQIVAQSTAEDNLITIAYGIEKEQRDVMERAVLLSRIQRIEEFLTQYRSPLANSAKTFVECGDRYGVDPHLLVGIAGKESSFGKHLANSFNPFGWTGGTNGNRFFAFDSFDHAICHVAKRLSENYEHWDIRKTAYKYAPPIENQTEKWIQDVTSFMKQI